MDSIKKVISNSQTIMMTNGQAGSGNLYFNIIL